MTPDDWVIPTRPPEPCGLFSKREEAAFYRAIDMLYGVAILEPESEIVHRGNADPEDPLILDVLSLLQAAFLGGRPAKY